MDIKELIGKIKERAEGNGFQGQWPESDNAADWQGTILKEDFARAFWGTGEMKVGTDSDGTVKKMPKWAHNLKVMASHGDPFEFLARFFIAVEKIEYHDFVFGEDVLLKTDYPYAVDSKDDWSPAEHGHVYHYKPLSLVADFNGGEEMAEDLLSLFPGKSKLLDLGTATGSVPLTMRLRGMRALGLEGLPVNDFGIENYMMKEPALFCWNVAPNLVANADITQPFRIENNNGELIQFDYIISTDCFEHLVTERIPTLLENIWLHLATDGYGIVEINRCQWMGIHQTCREPDWWQDRFKERGFAICEDLARADFRYVRSDMRKGKLAYKDGRTDEGKFVMWVRK